MLCRFAWLCVLCLLCLCRAASGHAQGDYDGVLSQALDAYEKRDLDHALSYFEQAHAIDPNARTLRGIGVVQLERGHPILAILALEAALVHPNRPLTEELEADVQTLLIKAGQQVATISLQTLPASTDATVDGAIPVRNSAAQFLLMPGVHALRVEAEGYAAYQAEVRVQAGQRETLRIALAHNPVRTESPRVQAPNTPPPIKPDSPHTRRPVTRALAVFGAASLVTAGALWATVLIRFNDIKDQCEKIGGCEPGVPRKKVEAAHLPGMQWGSRALSIAGAVSLSTGFALWMRDRQLEAKVSVSTQSAQLQLSF